MSTPAADRDPHDPAPPPGPDLGYYLRRGLKALASLQLTVVLFGLATVLVFFGTVAMMNQGLWTVVDDYFRSGLVWIPLDLVRKFGTVFFDLPKDGPTWPGSFPFPGGWAIGFVMLANLIAAHLVRFKLRWNRAGVIITHLGVIALMVGELVTGMYAVESTMMMRVGESADFVDVTREYEVAVTDSSDPAFDAVTVIPQRLFNKAGAVVDAPDLPFRLEVVEYWRNTAEQRAMEPFPPGTRDVLPAALPVGKPVYFRLFPRAEGAGVDTEARGDVPTARVRLTDKASGADLGERLLSLWAYPNFEQNRRVFRFADATVTAGGKTFSLLLRNKRVPKPYSVKLLAFEHGKYPGTDIPKDFASTVQVTDADGGDTQEARIWMNNPLRHQGDSLYQHAVMFEDSGTVLQVVRNPGRKLPYIACTMITLGMLVHFGARLTGFLGSRRRASA